MKNRKLENMILALTVFLVLEIFAFAIHVRPTADQVAVVKATGINFGVIADIEESLYAKQGVVTVEVNPDEGWVIVGYDSKSVQLTEIASIIAKTGYEITFVETFGVEKFRAINGMSPETNASSVGCGGACGFRK
ncbi:MAG: heavy-metal-associated domain-containing protein [Desulfobulbaceae bacterium]